MRKIVVAGIGTDVGKTIVSAILTHALNADYWKPVQCGLSKDRDTVESLLEGKRTIHPEALFLKTPRSPHHAAEVEGFEIDLKRIELPKTKRTLIIEGCGGILVPLNLQKVTCDLFAQWECEWVLVSRHYIGSINHTLLTLEVMKNRGLNVRGIIFNGEPCPQTEDAILAFSNQPCIGRIKQEKRWTPKRICDYSTQWKSTAAFQSAMLK
jgi:dethiobiotin synthetase